MTLKFTESVQSRLSTLGQFSIVFNIEHRLEFFGLRACPLRLAPNQHNWLSTMKKATEKIYFCVLSLKCVVFFFCYKTSSERTIIITFFTKVVFIDNAFVKKSFIFTTPARRLNPFFFSSNVLNDACLFNFLLLLKQTNAVTGNYNCSEEVFRLLQNSRNF